MLPREELLDQWIEHELNVLLIGRHGVGKTSLAKAAFERANLNWLYFSASTMDPWCDFVGVPRMVYDKETNQTYLKLIRPEKLADRNWVEAIFMDEFNRASKKIRNAVLELLQFKSINGEEFPNLKCIWAAINDDGDEEIKYDVEPLDEAQKDRFEVQATIPYEPSVEYFVEKYGDRLARPAIQWWKSLDAVAQQKVSPRRLDYVLRVFNKRGDIRYILPREINTATLNSSLHNGPAVDKLEKMLVEKATKEATEYLANDNQFQAAMYYIEYNGNMQEFFLPLLSKERLMKVMSKNERCQRFILSNYSRIPVFKDACDLVISTNGNVSLVQRINTHMKRVKELSNSFLIGQSNPDAPHFTSTSVSDWVAALVEIRAMPKDSTEDRTKVLAKLIEKIPADLTLEESVEVLELLDELASRTKVGVITGNGMPRLVNLVNHCIDQLHKHTGRSFKQILESHGTSIERLLNKLKGANLNNRLLKPGYENTTEDTREELVLTSSVG